MRSAYLSLGVDSNEEAERIYALLKEGGEVFMPMEETFFAFRFGMLRRQVRYVVDGYPSAADAFVSCQFFVLQCDVLSCTAEV